MPDETELQRFQTEAAAAAGLQHPNIVAVHAVGQQDGRRYYSMDFIEGPSLAKRLAAGPLPGRAPRATWSASPAASTTPTATASCTATSSRPTSCSTPTTSRTSPTSAWPSR